MEHINLLESLVALAGRADHDGVRKLFNDFNQEHWTIDGYSVWCHLFSGHPLPSTELVHFVMSCYPERDPLQYLVDILELPGQAVLPALHEACEILPALPLDDWALILQILESKDGMEACYDWISAKLGVFTSTLPSVNEAVQQLALSLRPYLTEECHWEGLRQQYALTPLSEKINLLPQLFPRDYVDSWVDELGPINQLRDLSQAGPLCRYWAGCRMYMCPGHGQVYDRSSCAQCYQSINADTSLRMPLVHGGWGPSYCGEECLTAACGDDKLSMARIQSVLEQISYDDCGVRREP